jgi:hypothetical protein
MWKQFSIRRAPKSPAVPLELEQPRRTRQPEPEHPFADLMAKLDRIPYPIQNGSVLRF